MWLRNAVVAVIEHAHAYLFRCGDDFLQPLSDNRKPTKSTSTRISLTWKWNYNSLVRRLYRLPIGPLNCLVGRTIDSRARSAHVSQQQPHQRQQLAATPSQRNTSILCTNQNRLCKCNCGDRVHSAVYIRILDLIVYIRLRLHRSGPNECNNIISVQQFFSFVFKFVLLYVLCTYVLCGRARARSRSNVCECVFYIHFSLFVRSYSF